MGVNGIYGLSGSGLDIESMVKVGMMSKQNQLDKMQQKTDLATWKKESMVNVYSDLSTYNYSTLTQYKLQSNMNAMSATSSDESSVKVSANGEASSMSHKVRVDSLSSNAYLITENKITRNNQDASKASSIYLADNLFAEGAVDESQKIYTLNGKDYTGYEKGDTTSKYTLHSADGGTYVFDITRVRDSEGNEKTDETTVYSRFNGYYLSGTDKSNALGMIDGTITEEKYIDHQPVLPSSKIVVSKETEFTFSKADSTSDSYTFTPTNEAGDGPYTYTYTDDEGKKQTLKLESDFSNIVDEDKFLLNGNIVSKTDVAVSFTLMDGTEDLSKLSEEDQQAYIDAHTVSYTYGELTASGKTYNDIAADINALGTNVKATYDAVNDSFSLYNSESGGDNKIELTMNTELAATLFNNLGLKQSNGTGLEDIDAFAVEKTNTTEGTSGSITIDGKTYSNVENNRITVSGVTYNLQDVTEAGETVNVVINQNTDAIIDRVKSFVEDYNKLLDGLYDKYTEPKYSDYKPLTSTQRDNMTDKQIEKWEEKSKSGLLYHDYTIRHIIDKMRSALSTPVDGLDSKYNSAYNLGIYTSKTNGHISLDEDKLKKALAEEPDAAYKIFGTLPEADEDGNYDYDSMGVAQRLGDVMVDAMKLVKTEAGETEDTSDGSNLGNKILELQTKMSDFKTLMSSYETQLYKKYDAMESLLATLGAQLNFVTGA